MFVLTTLVYPVVLALLCLGAGLLVDRASAGVLPAMLLLTSGAAALIVLSQLTTYVAPVAPATPYVLVAVACAGLLLGWNRAGTLARAWRTSLWQLGLVPVAYALALAPVLLAGRPSFSSYLALADSAVHMVGADFLIRHGQDYAHLDLSNSYGATINNYYNASYPSGADTLLGGSSFLVGLPLTWTFQPLTAFMLATATGPALVLARRVGLGGVWAAVAALTVTLPALVYAYELIGSVKEIVALPLILKHGRLGRRAPALAVAGGTWRDPLRADRGRRSWRARGGVRRVDAGRRRGARGGGALRAGPSRVETCPLRTSSPRSARGGCARAARRGMAHLGEPLRLGGRGGRDRIDLQPGQPPFAASSHATAGRVAGGELQDRAIRSVTDAYLGARRARVARGALGLGERRSCPPLRAGPVVRTDPPPVAPGACVCHYLGGCQGLDAHLARRHPDGLGGRSRAVDVEGFGCARARARARALVLAGGVLASDALQYNASNLAPTGRYDELASIDTRFAGHGPTLFTDFDEYALYELRGMDVGGPNFVYPPPALATAAGGHGHPVRLDRIAPAKLAAYPLIVMRRDPTAVRPPAAYRLLWQGVYYQVWGRRPKARPALAHLAVSAPSTAVLATFPPKGPRSVSRPGSARSTRAPGSTLVSGFGSARLASARARCLQVVEHLAARAHGGHLVGARAPLLIAVPIPRSRLYRPPGWARSGRRILMRRPGTLRLDFRLPHTGLWQLWLQGDVMRPLQIAIDGRPLGSLGAQLDGNSLVANTLSPLPARLSAGTHKLTIARPGGSLAPGDGGAAVLDGIFLTPAGSMGQPSLRSVPLARRRSLCLRPAQWVELLPGR